MAWAMAVRSATTPGRAEAEPGGTSIPTTMSVMANPMTPSANALQLPALKPPAGGRSEGLDGSTWAASQARSVDTDRALRP